MFQVPGPTRTPLPWSRSKPINPPFPPVEWVGPGKGWGSSNLQPTAMQLVG